MSSCKTSATRLFVKDAGFLKADIDVGQFFILGGQLAYVAEVGEAIKAPNGQMDARLRVIYSNGTESSLLRRSLQRALYKDEAGRWVTDPVAVVADRFSAKLYGAALFLPLAVRRYTCPDQSCSDNAGAGM